ncbi:MAG: chemotaxis response regulator protein-glutamate methylesterase [Sulfuricaulis sp.]|uniref:protein-glutamate methylesterase/protein-glutamine glutaminase n=1 Tax=Sulfuricaulis sp. TaxID=2003553 RepID=UPI003C387637
MKETRKIKALIIDDSAVMRQMLTTILHEDPAIHVVGTAANPLIAREKIKALKPDVLTLDVEMPGMDGITFLEKLMRLHPLPVVMVSSHTEKGAAATLRALDLGAVDFVAKPQGGVREGMTHELMDEIREKVRTAASAHVRAAAPTARSVGPLIRQPQVTLPISREGIIVIGASAGGTQAIAEITERLPRDTPGIAIVQHMPPKFTASFAERLNNQCALEVREAKSGDRLKQGVALVAPGGYHLEIMRAGGGYAVRVFEDEPVNRHRPSVDVLFNSAARIAGADALGIILTGMGGDGARGLQAMKMAGAYTIAQDEKSCVVFGMPEQAIRQGGVCEIASLDRIAERILEWANTEDKFVSSYSGDKSL